MKAVIISSSYSYMERVTLLEEAYQRKGYDTVVLMTDFVHASKTTLKEGREGYIFIKTKPYFKNISVQRLYSHIKFAKDAFKVVSEMQVDLLHVLIPANSLAKEADQYKKKHPNVKLYLDFIDLWPETMPINRFKNTFPFRIWKNLRDKNLTRTDAIYCECGLYKKVLKVENNDHYRILYWAKAQAGPQSVPSLSMEHIALCYLGSVNNIIDMDRIVEICKKLGSYKSVVLHLIANGEKKEEFLQKLHSNAIKVCDHGSIYDDDIKQQIFDQCHFGLNIMKSSVCVGLTMKSLDYFRAGLPIINNIMGDTSDFVSQYEIGFNVDDHYAEKVSVFQMKDYLRMRDNVKALYNQKFSKQAFFTQMEEGR